MNDFQLIILAGGKGTRMNVPGTPKVLVEANGKALIEHLLDGYEKAGFEGKPVAVVGYERNKIMERLGDRAEYVVQEEQLGTGHAVMVCKDKLMGLSNNTMVLYGDHPLVDADVMKKIREAHVRSGATMTLASISINDFEDWREAFYSFGRIVRNENNGLDRIVELKDASEEEKNIMEVSPSYFCFKTEWLWEAVGRLNNMNAQNEYYLTDLLGMAISGGEKVETVSIDPVAGLGVNTVEQLKIAEKILDLRNSEVDNWNNVVLG